MIFKPGDLPDLKYASEKLNTTSNWLYIKLSVKDGFICV